MNSLTFIRQLRPRVNDAQATTYTDDELLQYLNDSIVAVAQKLIALRDPATIYRANFIDGDTVPAGFCGFVGQVPIEIYDNTVHPYTQNKECIARFYKLPSKLEAVSAVEEIELPDKALPILFQMVAALALNRNEYDVTQELSFGNTFISGEAEVATGIAGHRQPAPSNN